MSASARKVWFVTGANSGFGRAIAEAAVAAGDVVVAAARRPSSLDELVAAHPDQIDAVQLDITDQSRISTVVDNVIRRHGRIDVLVNNAGRTHVGAVEEDADSDLRSLFEVHFFGPAALVRAVLPHMRQRNTGAIVQMSSMGGQMSFAGFSAYSATKFALEGLSEALADEVRDFGIKVLIVEPGAFRTDLLGAALRHMPILDAYRETVGGTRDFAHGAHGTQLGDPLKAAAAIEKAIEADDTPLRLQLGEDAVAAVRGHARALLEQLEAWEAVALDTRLDAAS
jgi:NAD(P)-dependent dehydrogenase (short-subunit alcohol dehydrogenase family)